MTTLWRSTNSWRSSRDNRSANLRKKRKDESYKREVLDELRTSGGVLTSQEGIDGLLSRFKKWGIGPRRRRHVLNSLCYQDRAVTIDFADSKKLEVTVSLV